MTRDCIATALLFVTLAASSACLEATTDKTAPGDGTDPVFDSSDPFDQAADGSASLSHYAQPDPFSAELAGGVGAPEPGAINVDRITPRFETAPATSDDFFRMPWPSDYRRTPEGGIDLRDFPNRSNGVVDSFLDTIERDVSGFSQMPVVYVVLDDAPDDLALPTPEQTLETDSPVQLIELTPSGCGALTPLEMVFSSEGDSYRAAGLLSVAPVVGFPLAPDTSYAFVIFDDFGSANGFRSAASAEMEALLNGAHPDPRLEQVYEPLWDCLDQLSIHRGGIAVATVFTTQDPVLESRLLREMVADPDRVPSPVIADWSPVQDDGEASYVSYTGSYQTPIFQRGESPYTSQGGAFVFDEAGEPVIQRWETVPFVVSWPRSDDASYPVMIWEDGTGAGPMRHLRRDFAAEAFEVGFAIASFTPQFHGDRAVPGSEPVLHSFNYLNPESGRTVFRQQAVDTSYFIRVLREALPDVLEGPVLDTERLVYGGHSQGALVGALLAGLEDEIVAYYLNGSGAYISETVVGRKHPVDIAAALAAFAQIDGEVSLFHPLIQMVQVAADAVDSYTYARYWTGWEGSPGGSHVFMTNGLNDRTTPYRCISHLTVAGDLAPINPTGWEVDPYGLWSRQDESLPILANRRALDGSLLTMASYLNAETGHHTVSDDAFARGMAIDFLWTALSGVPGLGLDW